MTRSEAVFGVCIAAVAATALAARLPRLDARPMHGDEANQAVKAGILLETGQYRYDPDEHHGPTLYWMTLPSLWLSQAADFGTTSEWWYRIVPVVFGAGLVVLLLTAGDGLGYPAALLAGVFTAISPAMVFYSRYYIQETLLVFFTFATILAAWRYVRRPSLGWAIAVGALLGLMHGTKETWVLAGTAMIAGLIAAMAWTRWRGGGLPDLKSYVRPRSLAAAAFAAISVTVVLYTSFGRNWSGPLDSLLCYVTYLQRGVEGGEAGLHSHPWYYYFELLFAYWPSRQFFWSEGLIAGLALVGCMAGLARSWLPNPQRYFVRWLAFYTLVLTAIYCLIPYKTPWCCLTFLHGMILLAGVGAWTILRSAPKAAGKSIAVLALTAGVAHLTWEYRELNFRFFADQRNPYVYAHSSTDVVNLAQQMDRLAAVSPDGREMVIHVVTAENYWPLPWYLRQFNRDYTGFWDDAMAWKEDTARLPPASLIVLTDEARESVDSVCGEDYDRRMNYGLRPGVILSVYVRRELWDAYVASLEPSD